MNNFHSDPPLYYRRWLTPLLQAASEAHSVVVLTGARQVGKSTLLRRAEPFAGWRYHTMDDFDTLRQVRENPASLWAGAHEVVLDEVQKAPDLLTAIKRAVDEHPGRYRFLLSGSANLLLMGNVSESLAGRAVYLVLDPLTLGELHGQPPPALLADVLAGRWPEEGTLPEALPDPVAPHAAWFHACLLTLARRRIICAGGKATLPPTWSAISGRCRRSSRWWTSGASWRCWRCAPANCSINRKWRVMPAFRSQRFIAI